MTKALTMLSLLLACHACGDTPAPRANSMSVAQALGGAEDSTGFARAFTAPELRFPQDHGPHPAFRTEWWYVTGNVDSANGRRFGVQFVFFRHALAAVTPARAASLAARDVVFAHAAVTDVGGGRFWFAERFARAAAGLGEVALPQGSSFRAVCADWSAMAAAGGDGFLPLDLRAADRAFGFALRVSAGKPVVLQGDRGLSRKSDEPGNASIYYSLTRLPIAGTIDVGGERHDVQGLCWLDREWSTSALGAGQVGWDWFSLQLDDGSDLMWYQLRRDDGGIDPWSRGVSVDRDGTATPLAAATVTATPSGSWTAADGRARYPARWRLAGGEPAFELEIEPLLPDQELTAFVRYWEGAVAVRGTRGGRPVSGRGYLEMTGYADAAK